MRKILYLLIVVFAFASLALSVSTSFLSLRAESGKRHAMEQALLAVRGEPYKADGSYPIFRSR